MEKGFKMALSAFAASLTLYFDALIVPIAVLAGAMIIDYISGIAAAWFNGELNSKTGKLGAIKKVCYMFLVISAGIIDWLICCGLSNIGVDYQNKYYFGLIVAVWLIINELLSILENCTRIGLPIPAFLKPIAKRLKIIVEEKNGEE